MELLQSIRNLTTEKDWDEGQALFSSGGVLDAHYSPKSVESRIANEQGLFERTVVAFRPTTITCRCTCSSRSSYCKHIVALLLYIAKETPELLNCLIDNESTPIASPEKIDQALMRQALSDNSVTLQSLKKYLGNDSPQASLSLHCKTELPQLILSRQTLTLTASLLYNGNHYTQGNIKKLIDHSNAAGNMRLSDFDPQTQQVMSFLLQHAQFSAQGLTLDSETCADLFHCLRGSSILETPSGTVQFHLSPLQIHFNITPQPNGSAVIVPELNVPNRGALSSTELSFVAGRAGYWIGIDLEYWWFPAILPFNWLRLFIQGNELVLTPLELAKFTHLCENKHFPGTIHLAQNALQTELVNATVKPILTLDWNSSGLLADLQFDYSGRRVEVGTETIVWLGKNFARRNAKDEQAAMSLIQNAGFTRNDETWHGMTLTDDEAIYQFMNVTLPTLSLNWMIFMTPQVRINTISTSEATFTIQTGQENNGWFDASCDLKAADGTPIPFQMAVDAVQNDDEFIHLPSGAVTKLPEKLFHLISTLVRISTERQDNKLKLRFCHSLTLVDELKPYWTGPKPDWHSLKERLLHPQNEKIPKLHKPLLSKLRDYQKEGLKWLSILQKCSFNGILADEMGLGKTIQALALLSSRKLDNESHGTSLVVCPTSLVENWRAEANRFAPELSIIIINGTNRIKMFQSIQEYDLAITSYALLRRDILDYEELEFDYVILDEAQHIKNPKTANAQACKGLNSAHRLVLTGTPLENSLLEIWSIFDFLQPKYLGSQKEFKQNFLCKNDPEKQNQKTKELSGLIRPFVLRRTKDDVCKELPPKLEQDVFCEMGDEQRKLYDYLLLATRSFLSKLDAAALKAGPKRIEMLAMILRLRQVCCHPGLLPEELREDYPEEMPSVKLDLAKEVILESIDSGHRLLFFSQFTNILKLIKTWLKKEHIEFEYIDGTTTDRQKRVDHFNNDPQVPIFLLSLKAGGIGLNLPGADTVIHYDQWWNPMVEDQATDRSHRIGQTRTVTSIRLVTRNTIEEKIIRLQNSKRNLFNKLIGDTPSALNEITEEEINYLINNS